MKVQLIRDEVDIRAEGQVLPVNSLPGRQLALIAQIHQSVGDIARDGTDVGAYAEMRELMIEMMRINEVDPVEVDECRMERRERLGGFRKGRIWTRDVQVFHRDIPGYPDGS